MQTSESVKEIAVAMHAAQAMIGTAKKTSANPYYKSKYADLTECWEAIQPALQANGLSVVQAPVSSCDNDGNVVAVGVETMLMHTSGEWMRERFYLPLAKQDAQGGGSAVTYARRYALCAFFVLLTEDDDGNRASEPLRGQQKAPPKENRAKLLDVLEGAAKAGMVALELCWKKQFSPEQRDLCQGEIERLKAVAKEADRQLAGSN